MCIRWLTRPSSITLFPYTTLSDLLERLPLDEVHRVVVQALGLADLVHGHHVRMPDLGQRLGLAAQAVDRAVVVRRRQDLHGDVALEALLPRQPHLAHAASAEAADQLQRTEALTCPLLHRQVYLLALLERVSIRFAGTVRENPCRRTCGAARGGGRGPSARRGPRASGCRRAARGAR